MDGSLLWEPVRTPPTDEPGPADAELPCVDSPDTWLASPAMTDLPAATHRLQAVAARSGLVMDVRRFPAGTKTATQAAVAVGCDVAAIVKSLVFVVDDEPVVALVPGDHRLDTERLARAAGGTRARRATLDEVREATGFAAGGTPPFGYPRPLRVFADPLLARNDPVWAAAGTPDTVFPVSVPELLRISRAVEAEIAERP